MPYASRTGTRRNLAVMRSAGWRILVTPAEPRTEGFPYALDNGAWSASQTGLPWNEEAFVRLCSTLGDNADWVVAPDIVAGGLASLRLSEAWLPRLASVARRRLVAVQDGMTTADVCPLLGPEVGIFVGGSTEWKLGTMRSWGMLARERGAYLHIGRVNTARRIRLCQDAGADSFDGTSVSRYATTLELLDSTLRQQRMFRGLPPPTTTPGDPHGHR